MDFIGVVVEQEQPILVGERPALHKKEGGVRSKVEKPIKVWSGETHAALVLPQNFALTPANLLSIPKQAVDQLEARGPPTPGDAPALRVLKTPSPPESDSEDEGVPSNGEGRASAWEGVKHSRGETFVLGGSVAFLCMAADIVAFKKKRRVQRGKTVQADRNDQGKRVDAA